ncbi:fatty acid-binding protein, liver-like isoform X3 [Poecilia formosa]|uniref:fatty acid-binding protein, liver-like isoform X3 n=1 Tax=Poecilia formosa TaxID=48698 RepID=UPI0007B798E2|nr:PREDICTED: fatty acid-binding protein, liver-like isoform X3 [Poecilia formosa]
MQKVGMKEPLLTFACSAKPNLIITRDKETISAEAKSTLKTHKIKFKLNEEFDEKTPGGHQVKSKVFLRDGKLIQEQRWVGKSTTLERVIENGKLEVTSWEGDTTRTDLLFGNRLEATCEMCQIKQLIRYSSYFFPVELQ